MQSTVNERIDTLINFYEKGKQKRFAEAIGVNPTVINNIVAGRGNKPSFDVLQKITEAYANVNINWLLNGEGEMLKDSTPMPGQNFSNKGKGNINAGASVSQGSDNCREELMAAKERIAQLESELALFRNKYIALLEKSQG